MTQLDLSQLKQVLDTTTQDLFRWETLPAYEVASDGSDYRRYLDGADAPTPERKQPWLDTLREWAKQGRPRHRVRLIHDPITDYERYACEWGYALNSQAGRSSGSSTSPRPRYPRNSLAWPGTSGSSTAARSSPCTTNPTASSAPLRSSTHSTLPSTAQPQRSRGS